MCERPGQIPAAPAGREPEDGAASLTPGGRPAGLQLFVRPPPCPPQATLQDKHKANELLLQLLGSPGSAVSELGPGQVSLSLRTLAVSQCSVEMALLVFKARRFGSSSLWCRCLTLVVPGVGFKPLVSQGDTLDFEFPPDCGLLCLGWGRSFMAGLCPSLLYLLAFGLLSLVWPSRRSSVSFQRKVFHMKL